MLFQEHSLLLSIYFEVVFQYFNPLHIVLIMTRTTECSVCNGEGRGCSCLLNCLVNTGHLIFSVATLLRILPGFLPLLLTCGDARLHKVNAQTMIDTPASLGYLDNLLPW